MRKVLVLGSVCVAVLHGSSHAGSALDKPSFSATPAELLAAAKTASPGDWPVVRVRADHDIRFDERGRAVHRVRYVLAIRSQAGVDDWGTLSLQWSPFYQDKPIVRARVIAPDGTIANLDPSTMSDSPAVEKSASVFSDRRELNAPLPRLQIGSVIEEEITTTDREPILATFGQEAAWLTTGVPTESTHIVIAAPPASKVRVIARGLDAKVKPRHETKAGLETWTYDLGRLGIDDDEESNVPAELIAYPKIAATTAPSWAVVAAAYRKVVDKRIADGVVQLPAELPRAPTEATARAITAWLHKQIRYTGIEFGEASNVPWPPAETVKRGFGDCKDKATLLIALLRQAGIRADLALLYDGPGIDLDPDLPAMDVFDHAIVRARIGTTDLWIDATEDLVPAGRLPVRDQGRRALVIADDTTQLVKTPWFDDNRTREVVTFTIPETGKVKVTSVDTRHGLYAVSSRQWIGGQRADEIKKGLASWISNDYKGTLDTYSIGNAGDLDKPFELTIEYSGSTAVDVLRERIDLEVNVWEVLDELPDYLTKKPRTDEKPRKRDYEWQIARVHEVEHRFVLPPGFAPPPAEPVRTRALGTATLSQEVRIDGQTVIVAFRLDSGKRRLSPKEITDLRTALRAEVDATVKLACPHRAWSALARKDTKTAVAEVQKLIALHPKEAVHHDELAQIYVFAGAGAAARRSAARAIELEPKTADAYAVKGWVLRHGTIGTDYGADHDRAGALAAYAKARVLDPKHVGAAVEYARLLERDGEGRISTVTADLHAAVEAWKVAVKLDDTQENREALIRALLRDGQVAEAETRARAAKEVGARNSLLLAAIGYTDPAKAISAAGSLASGNGRASLLARAGGELYMQRRYAQAVALMIEGGLLRAGSPEATESAKIVRHDEKLVIGKDPKAVAIDLVLSLYDTRYRPLTPMDDEVWRDIKKSLKQFRKKFLQLQALGPGALRDMAFSTTAVTVAGGPQGPWHVEVSLAGQTFPMILGLAGGQAKLLGMSGAASGVGAAALQRLAAKDAAGARTLVEWLMADEQKYGTNPAIVRLWNASAKDDKAVAVVAALASKGTESLAIPVLEKCDTTAPDARKSCDPVLVIALAEARRWADLDRAATAWQQREPTSDVPPLIRAAALSELGKFDEAEAMIAPLHAKAPDALFTLLVRAQISVQRKDMVEAAKRFDALVASPQADAKNRSRFGWFVVAAGGDLKRALEVVQAGQRLEEDAVEPVLAAAALEAEKGELSHAIDDVWKSLDLRDAREPDSPGWYVLARIYEQLDLRADAEAAYKRVKAKPDDDHPSPFDLAQKRLKLLGKP